ncbi:MAG: nucleotide pyrophosphohydrolase [Candidatus Wallbacteria bacterium]
MINKKNSLKDKSGEKSNKSAAGQNETSLDGLLAEKKYKDSKTTIDDLKKIMKSFVAERDWQQYHDPKNLSMSIAIEAAELMELFQWLTNEQVRKIKKDSPNYTDICDELSDIMLYCMSLANVLGIDLSQAITEKVVKNVKKYPKEKCRGRYEKPKKVIIDNN